MQQHGHGFKNVRKLVDTKWPVGRKLAFGTHRRLSLPLHRRRRRQELHLRNGIGRLAPTNRRHLHLSPGTRARSVGVDQSYQRGDTSCLTSDGSRVYHRRHSGHRLSKNLARQGVKETLSS